MSTDAAIKVAIIGGGCAAMTTAFELSRPEHGGRFAITVYQMGWRLGGKGASGRGPSARIEEHGLHIWMGWYENAFRLMRECYDELGRAPGTPLATWRDAFSPLERIGVADRIGGGDWSPWSAAFPPADGLPGDPMPDGPDWSVPHYLRRTAELLASLFETLRGGEPSSPLGLGDASAAAPDTLRRMLALGELASLAGLVQACSLLAGLMRSPISLVPESLVLDIVDAVARNARAILEKRLREDVGLARVWQIIDLALCAFRGVLADGILTDPRGFDAIDEYDCREWLRRNGASDATLDCGFLRALYDLGFSYADGDSSRPSISAGQAMRGTLRTFFTYRGAFFWTMHAGMGDVVFAPLYEVLRRRGVRFEFFHALRDVGLAGAGDSPYVETLSLDVQARIRGDSEYHPLIDVGGLPCWPAQPLYDQLVDGERLRAAAPRFESPASTPVAGGRVLRVTEDFDFVVLGIGLGAVASVCRQLIESNEDWRRMTEEVKTVATQAFQIWLRDDLATLGWANGPVALSGFVEPFDTWADMTHLLPAEAWPDPSPRTLAYFCNVLPESDARRADVDSVVRAGAEAFLDRHVATLWPNASTAGGGFDWSGLVRAGDARAGASGLDGQFWRANVEPSDRYTLSVPGSARYRISPLDRTYDNLTITGDWTACGFEAGCVEAAVMSGRLAAHALSGAPALEDIVGYDHP